MGVYFDITSLQGWNMQRSNLNSTGCGSFCASKRKMVVFSSLKREQKERRTFLMEGCDGVEYCTG